MELIDRKTIIVDSGLKMKGGVNIPRLLECRGIKAIKGYHLRPTLPYNLLKWLSRSSESSAKVRTAHPTNIKR